MTWFISGISLLVPDYDEALAFYVGVMGFTLIEDTDLGAQKRWVVVAPPGAREATLILAKAQGEAQSARIGDQAGGRVWLFLTTEDFDADYASMQQRGVRFLEAPRNEPYGKVAVFCDPFGNKWDLIEPVQATR
jgi:catechol 2,3-dioxygenase-like lactoylglutathione lyase family enzyme